MNVKREFYKTHKDLPHEEYLAPGSPLCAGCGALTTLRLMHKVMGENVIVVNAAGCMTLMATYPFTPLRSSWLYTNMGSASAGAQGVRDALDILIKKGRVDPKEDLKVLVLAGDGSTYDMGLSSTSGAIYRDLDFWYLCYDNEAYGNTGFQASSSSPWASATATTRRGDQGKKKDIYEIWRAHKPPYMATISSHEPADLGEKVKRAMQYKGPKLFLAFAACPTGWGFDPGLSDEIAKRALSTGVWPLKETIYSQTRHTDIPKRLKPVELYLEPQRRFRHLFKPERNEEAIMRIQARVNDYWEEVRANEIESVPAS